MLGKDEVQYFNSHKKEGGEGTDAQLFGVLYTNGKAHSMCSASL